MKGKVNFFVALPNLSRLRSRLENPSKELTSEIRNHLTTVIVDVVNKNSLAIQAALIDFISNKEGVTFKTKEHKKQVENLFSGIFAVGAAVDRAGIDALCGDDEDDAVEATESAEEPAPAETKKPAKKRAKAAEKSDVDTTDVDTTAAAEPEATTEDEDEFDD